MILQAEGDESVMLTEKNVLRNNVRDLLEKSYVKKCKNAFDILNNLYTDIKKDELNIVVVGEFSRGKSTFINALLETKLLPMDVLQETATINIIRYSECPSAKIYMLDGTYENGDCSYEYLKEYSAQNENSKYANVSHIDISIKNEFLKNKITLVDTPGVADLDDLRAEITYNYVPKADVIIFVLDATAPFKKSEKEFLEKRILPQGIKNIFFVANKFDNVDEDDEDEVKRRLVKRIHEVVPNSTIFTISSSYALKGCLKNDARLIEASDILKLKNSLIELLEDENREQLKLERYNYFYSKAFNIVEHRLKNDIAIKEASQKRLYEMMENIRAQIADKEEKKKYIHDYTLKTAANINSICDKSIKYFYDRLEDDIISSIMEYKGSDFKDLVETKMVKRFKREIENWIGIYSPHIDRLLKMFSIELSRGLSELFAKKVNVTTNRNAMQIMNSSSLSISAMDLSNTDITAGAISAIGGIGLTLLAGSMFMPFVSFAAMPMIRRSMLEHKLAEAKEAVIPEMTDQMRESILQLRQNINSAVIKSCEQIEENISYAYEKLLEEYAAKMREQMVVKGETQENIEVTHHNLKTDMQDLQKYI